MKIGLYFGSFNPIHNGHLIIATHILQHTALDQIWFVVSPQNPFKQSTTLLNEYHRLHLVQQAIEGETKLKASDIEFSLPRPSYTIDTLTYLEEKYPENSFSVIMGSDSYQNIAKWKSGDVLQKRYPILVYQRPGFAIAEDAAKKATILNAPMLDISSTIIRKLVASGLSIRYMVPEAVNEEILKSGYYK
jgi:nicotinate-nucleotide adenylyltransferase